MGIRDKGPYPGVQRGLMASRSRCSISAFWIASGSELDVREDVDAIMVSGLSSPCEKNWWQRNNEKRRSKAESRTELRKQRSTYEQLIQCRMLSISTSPKLFPLFESTSLSNSLGQLPYRPENIVSNPPQLAHSWTCNGSARGNGKKTP